MRSPAARIAIGVATLAAVVVLFIVFAGGDDEGDNNSATTTTQAAGDVDHRDHRDPQAAEPEVAADRADHRARRQAGGRSQEADYNNGDRIRFVVTSDVADEVHVHGYDIAKDVPAGGSVRFGFPAKLEGVFEVELEDRKEQIAELRVSP